MALADKVNQIVQVDDVLTNIIELTIKQLELFGIELTDTDDFELSLAVNKIQESIKNTTNQLSVPEGLTFTAVNMICGEFLHGRNATNRLEGFSVEQALKSVKVGDATLDFGGGHAPDIGTFINHLLVSGRGDVLSYRKLKW